MVVEQKSMDKMEAWKKLDFNKMFVGDDWKDPLANTHLIISNNFDFSVLEDTNTGVGGSKIDTDSGGFRHFELIWKLTLLSNLYLY